MSKKIFLVFLIMFLVVFNSICFATDSINMDLSNTSNSNNSSNFVDTTTVDGAATLDRSSTDESSSSDASMPSVSTTTDYDDSGEMSITNIINIILIVVGIVIIFLGIAIIIKIK